MLRLDENVSWATSSLSSNIALGLWILLLRWVKDELSQAFVHIPTYIVLITRNSQIQNEVFQNNEMNTNENKRKRPTFCIYSWKWIESNVAKEWEEKTYMKQLCCFSLFVCTKFAIPIFIGPCKWYKNRCDENLNTCIANWISIQTSNFVSGFYFISFHLFSALSI